MKKILVLLLALVLTVGAASAAFTDESRIGSKYQAAVAAMSELGVIGGFPDGSFKPKDTLTRAQAAKIICAVLEGADKVDAITATASFADVPAEHWAAKFIGYCAEKGIVSGVGGGKFNPNGQLTGAAFGKMLLVAYGHNAETEGLTGSGWDTHVAELMAKEGRDFLLTVTNDPLPRQEACQMAYNFTFPAADTSAYAETTVDLKADTTLYKTYGRTYMGEDGAAILWPGSAVEFTAELSGDLMLHYRSMENIYVRTFVDGEENFRTRVTGASTARKLKVALNIRPGVHTVRLVRETDASTNGTETFWSALTFNGVKSSVKAPQQKALYIEFVGASTLAGKGALRGGVYAADDDCHSASSAFSYGAAQLLDADWSLVARGGSGVAPTGSVSIPTSEFYDYVNPWAGEGSRIKYDFARKPDVVVIGTGGNDYKLSGEKFKELAKALIEEIRDRNGRDVKIVVVYNEMVHTFEKEWREIIAETGIYGIELVTNNQGGSSSSSAKGHPSAAGHAVNAKLLADYIRETVL